MYAGHAAVALALKSREPRLPLIPLTLASFGPDWLELAMMYPHRREGMAVYSHSVPAVVIGALVAGAVYGAFRRPGAGSIVIAWLLHWPADLFTGRKPLFVSEPLIGLDLYKLPLVDFTLESVVILVGCALYARRFAPRGDLRRVVVCMGTLLIVIQGAADVALSVMRTSDWSPSLANVTKRSQLVLVRGDGWLGFRMPFAFRPSHSFSEGTMASNGPRGVVTLVCLTCGKEKFFTKEVPAAVSCEQCGSTVFRTFATPTEPDEAAIDALEAQARSMAYGDSSPDTTQDDVRDLDLR